MVGPIDVPGLTGGQPASLAPDTYQLLRTESRFDGVAFTDDLGAMRAVTSRHTVPEAALLALTAGADIALWSSGGQGSSSGQVSEVIDVLEKALATGRLPAVRVDEAVRRVLRAKSACPGTKTG
jgi:beta-N-acetylhexosaminidase